MLIYEKYFLFLKLFSTKLLLIPFVAFNASIASASLYTITFSSSDFSAAGTPARGTLEGFITVDESLANSAYTQNSSNAFISIPNWLTAASFTFTNTDGNTSDFPTVTRSLTSSGDLALSEVSWRTQSGTLDASATDFVGQMTRLAFRNNEGDFVGRIPVGIGQQVYDEEFTLTGNQPPQAVPGPLPILGIAPLAWYFRKFKKKSLKL